MSTSEVTPPRQSVSGIRARFCPSPTGSPHVGLIRTALFNWAFARHNGGTLVFRIEDTDVSRDSEESYRALFEALRWLGLDWDEGPDIGGEYGPYRQSLRREIYSDIARRLLEAGELYESFSTSEEVEARHRAAGRDPKLGYDNADRDLTDEQKAQLRAEGRSAVLRLKMPERDISFTDLVRGEVTFPAGTVPDPVLVRGNGDALYTLTNPVDDALMRITHVLRGEDLLASTPRQIALYEALRRIGVTDFTPEFGHLPFVMGEGNKKLSKRDPQSDVFHHRNRGFLPEGLLNYLGLLGWSIAEDRDMFSLEEMVENFEIGRVSSNPARFDQKKADAINAAHLRALAPDDFVARIVPYLVQGGVLPQEPTEEQLSTVRAAAPLVQERLIVLSDAVGMMGFLFAGEDFAPEQAAADKALGEDARPVLEAAIAALEALPEWTKDAIESALKEAIVEGLGIKPRKAFAPVRVAITGRTVSPPLFESMEILGRETSLRRLRAALG
ncbi:glutamyl-tRNA synthetase [Halopolyspora algeriensis]|uniref:Glutamate--tRNA ligase n=1 Tax=Halopolyspora algeriensis TaxID=1500506 RepID=A0A368VCY6_9ACTN|nr:glutamate--tRNA ligase [Halopolyspora algeriensis]RCW39147.1 glutamyl-tRNA synthetase [Halopolyspora algeriensis]TQM56556.1 glutamyl-tRNA synthetase [Halopolyspora algeriensis]